MRLFHGTHLLVKYRFYTPSVKKLVRRNYKNAYLDTKPAVFSKKKLLRRLIYIFLLELGLLALLIQLIPHEIYSIFLTPEYGLDYYVGELGIPAPYISNVLISLTLLLIPVVNGLWVIGWVLEDAGLMHFNFSSKNGDSLFEVEPIYRNYTYYLKGYAGISSIIFLIQVILAWTEVSQRAGEDRISDIIMTIFLPALTIIISLPIYYIYGKYIDKKFLIKEDLRKLKNLTESEILAD